MKGHWHDHVDIYCERTAEGLLNEPVNFFTNFAFIIGAYFAYRIWRREIPNDKPMLALVITLGLVGVGSFLFHSFANVWSMFADVFFIYVYIVLAVCMFGRRVVGAGYLATLGLLGAFIALVGIFKVTFPPETLNGSIEYAPAFVLLLAFGAWVTKKSGKFLNEFVIAGLLLCASLFFRSIDLHVCEYDPLGISTHFMWHVLNGTLLFFIIKGIIKYRVK